MDCSLPDSSVHEIFQARILEWVAISSSGGLPDPEVEAMSPALAGRFFAIAPPGKPPPGCMFKTPDVFFLCGFHFMHT